MMLEIIKTKDGYMVQSTDGDYVCDANGDNLFDTLVEANAVFWGLPIPPEAEIQSAKAHKAFYAWEDDRYGDNSHLSDDHRMVWVEGYLQALKDAK
jgi:hypothetical protein